MIKMTPLPVVPVDQDVQVDVQVTLTYKASELRELADRFSLGDTLATAAADALRFSGVDDYDPYGALREAIGYERA